MSEKQLFKHSVPVQIRYNDIDLGEHVNNAVYLHYYGYGRLNYLDTVFNPVINWKEEGFIILKNTIEYIKPILLHDNISVFTRISKLGNKSFEMEQAIYNQDNELASTCATIMVGYDYTRKESMPIPEHWIAKIKEYEIKVEVFKK